MLNVSDVILFVCMYPEEIMNLWFHLSIEEIKSGTNIYIFFMALHNFQYASRHSRFKR